MRVQEYKGLLQRQCCDEIGISEQRKREKSIVQSIMDFDASVSVLFCMDARWFFFSFDAFLVKTSLLFFR